jgi:recombinational DNA repair protein RecR
MTREEAIKWLNIELKEWENDCLSNHPVKEALRVAIEALEQEPRKGHWIEEFNDVEGEVRFTCSCCGKYQLFETDYCYNCGSDNREV